MAIERVADLTMQELRTLIGQMIDERMKTRVWPRQSGSRVPEEVFESMRKNIIKPKSGEPSAVEMVLEDRDRWNSGSYA